MIQDNKLIDIMAVMFLGTFSLVASVVLFSVNIFSAPFWKVLAIIFFIIFGTSYYVLIILFLSHYIEKFGNLLKNLYHQNKKIFITVLTLIFFVIMFPILTYLLGDTKKVVEIYSYVLLTAVVTLVINKFATKKDSTNHS